MHKIWHKPLHKRKIWKQMSLFAKIIYYMQPFVSHLLDTWMQPLPFPTVLKFLYSCFLMILILLPILYPSAVCLICYAELQYFTQRHCNLVFPQKFDLLGYAQRVAYFQLTNEKHSLFVMMYLERWRILGTAIASGIDYMRLTLSLLFGE